MLSTYVFSQHLGGVCATVVYLPPLRHVLTAANGHDLAEIAPDIGRGCTPDMQLPEYGASERESVGAEQTPGYTDRPGGETWKLSRSGRSTGSTLINLGRLLARRAQTVIRATVRRQA